MKTCNILLSAITTFASLFCVAPCGASSDFAAGAASGNDAGAGGRTAGASVSADAASLALNKSITRRVYEEGLNQGRFEVPYSESFVGHGGGATFTHAQGMAEARGWRDAFPDLRITVEKQVAEQDLVAVHWTARGTNTGTGNGIPATGRSVEITGTTMFRLDDGRIAEEWTCANSLGLMRQLGMLQTTTAARSAASDASAPANR